MGLATDLYVGISVPAEGVKKKYTGNIFIKKMS